MFPNSSDDLILEKLIVLYILNNLEEGVTDSQLTQIVSKTDVMNYFTLMVAIQKMKESKFIMSYTKNNRTLYAITQNGLEVLVYFQNRIPEFFIEKIDKYLKENSEEIYSSIIKNQSTYSLQGDSSYAVTLMIIEGRKDVMTINVSVDTETEAKELCRKWNESYRDKYEEIFKILNQ